jgi:hypothetical protein
MKPALAQIVLALVITVGGYQLLPGQVRGQAKTDEGEKSESAKLDFSWRQTSTSVALLNRGRVVWQHVHDRETGKPFMRIGLLDGTELTRPWPFSDGYPKRDHVWHKALWWSWKAIDGINYWEENQRGTDPVDVKVTTHKDGSATIHMTVSYHLPDKPPVVTEERVIRVGAPDVSGSYIIDWQTTFKPAGEKDVVFNQNSYGGLAIRMAAEFCGDVRAEIPAWKFIKSEEKGSTEKGAARWMAYRGVAQNGNSAAIAMFSHPANPRYPALWQTRDHYPYLNPSFTCKEDYTLRAGESLTLRYGVLVHQGEADLESLETAWKEFAGRSSK